MGIRCFLLEPAGWHRAWLRRYGTANGASQSECVGYHNAMLHVGDFPGDVPTSDRPEGFLYGLRWPTKCDHCSHLFAEHDPKQYFTLHLYRRPDTGELLTLRNPPPGAMWYADWMIHGKHWRGPDGHCLCVQTPGGQWMVDGEASNCTRKGDLDHKCWVRHGVPPLITVDKNGNTCSAGAGSIQAGKWHGFLRNGELVEA